MEDTIYKEVFKVFGVLKAVYVSQIIAVQFTMKIKKSDLEKGAFEQRLKKKVRKKVLWRLPEKDFNEVWKIWGCIHDLDINQSFPTGMGGCASKSLRQLYDEKE